LHWLACRAEGLPLPPVGRTADEPKGGQQITETIRRKWHTASTMSPRLHALKLLITQQASTNSHASRVRHGAGMGMRIMGMRI